MPNIKIASYNIHHGIDINGKVNLEAILEVLQQIDADIVALQEVDMLRPQTQLQKQADRLAKQLSMSYVYGAVRRYKPGSYGNAILSRYPITSSKNHLLEESADYRCCLQADLDIDGTVLSIFNTHLGLKQPVRYKHLKETILPLILPLKHPAVLAGDFNAPDSRPEVKMLSAFLLDTFTCNSGPLIYTYPAGNPSARIDYIFINRKCIPFDYYIVDSAASDHLPVVAEIGIL